MNRNECYLLVVRTIRGGMQDGVLSVLAHDDIQATPLSLEDARMGLAAECLMHAAGGWNVQVKDEPEEPGFCVIANRHGLRRVVRAIHVDMVEQLGQNAENN